MEDRNGIITQYTVTLSSEGINILTTTTSDTSLRLDSLSPFTSYTCAIAAETEIGVGPFSPEVTVVTAEDGTF